MALHDVDKTGAKRLSPAPNTNDGVALRMAHGTTGFTLVTESTADAPALLIKDGKIQVVKSDGTLLAQLGFRDTDGDGAVDVAKPGQSL